MSDISIYVLCFLFQDDAVHSFDAEATAASKAFGVKEADVDEINNKILAALKLSSKSAPGFAGANTLQESMTQKRQNECAAASKGNRPEVEEPKIERPRDQTSVSNSKKDSENLEDWLDDFLG